MNWQLFASMPQWIIRNALERERQEAYFSMLCKGNGVSQEQEKRILVLTKELSKYNGLSAKDTLDCVIRGMLGFDMYLDNAYLSIKNIKCVESALNKYTIADRHKTRAVAIITELERQVAQLSS